MKTILTVIAILVATSGASYASAPSHEAGISAKSEQGSYTQEARRKKRVPGGSGCDDAHDKAEHPECRG